ncbi:hypothetical protein [Enterobacter sp. PTB]|uniref:hypothetical protein n=1 Tax=Enterobacter sp. PTB TaxID=3143437 RepID=UPI003DA8B37A
MPPIGNNEKNDVEAQQEARSRLDGCIATFDLHYQELRDAEKKLHNLQASRDRAQQKIGESSRKWTALMAAGDGSMSEEADALDKDIADATRLVERLTPLVEEQAIAVLRLRIPARKAALDCKNAHQQAAEYAIDSALTEVMQTLPLLVAQPVKQLIGLCQLAGIRDDYARRAVTDAVDKIMKGDCRDVSRVAIEQNDGTSRALTLYPPSLSVDVAKSLRFAPSVVQERLMKDDPAFERRLALGQEKMRA